MAAGSVLEFESAAALWHRKQFMRELADRNFRSTMLSAQAGGSAHCSPAGGRATVARAQTSPDLLRARLRHMPVAATLSSPATAHVPPVHQPVARRYTCAATDAPTYVTMQSPHHLPPLDDLADYVPMGSAPPPPVAPRLQHTPHLLPFHDSLVPSVTPAATVPPKSTSPQKLQMLPFAFDTVCSPAVVRRAFVPICSQLPSAASSLTDQLHQSCLPHLCLQKSLSCPHASRPLSQSARSTPKIWRRLFSLAWLRRSCSAKRCSKSVLEKKEGAQMRREGDESEAGVVGAERERSEEGCEWKELGRGGRRSMGLEAREVGGRVLRVGAGGEKMRSVAASRSAAVVPQAGGESARAIHFKHALAQTTERSRVYRSSLF